MRKIFAAGFAVLALSASAMADTLSSWSFESATISGTSATNSPSPATADGGIFQAGTAASGVHASASSAWSSPAGNGSAKSYSGSAWAVADYYQFKTSSVGYGSIVVDFDATSSNTGPRDFNLQYSTDGTSYTTFTSYSVLANAAPNNTWSSLPANYRPEHHYTFNLSSVTAINNATNLYFRLTVNSAISANGGAIAAGGTSRVDNFTVGGTVVPEPTSLALLALGSLALIRRR